MSASHHVVFKFRLPPVLLLHAEPGIWPRSPRGCTVVMTEDGAVTVTSVDHSQTYAGAFLRASVRDAPATMLTAELDAPYCRERPVQFQISLGARVSIAQTEVRPYLADNDGGILPPAPRRARPRLRLAAG
jgi:hypothetical protein